ncbi:MAG: efflux RND transporter periplasmic adaptor subunit [Acetobacteraceae bacterium]|nr:efflux RND transporter periplasmic adaptor subunit [Acetobacteraceae bacterium]
MRAAIVFALALAVIAGCKRQNAYVPPPPPSVGVAQPARQPVTPYLQATGSTVAFNEVDLVARITGFLQDIRYEDGARAKRGDTLFVIEPAPYQAQLQQAQAALASAQAQAAQSDAEYKRQASLGRSDFASQSAVDQARATRDSNQAQVQTEQAAVTLAATNLGYTQVTAPFDGTVTAHLVSVGSLVGAGGPTKLATVVQLDPIYVTFNISEQDVLRIRSQMAQHGISEEDIRKVPVEVGLMTDTGYPHAGKLDYADPQVNTSTGTLMVRGVFANAEHILLPGYFVRVRVPLMRGTAEQLLVPDAAIGADQSGRYVLLVDKDNVVQQHVVQTGQLVGTLRVIQEGLRPDDRVIVTGLQRAVVGEKVAPTPAEIKAAAMPQPDKS